VEVALVEDDRLRHDAAKFRMYALKYVYPFRWEHWVANTN
jgi:hypothetical protein